MVRVRVAGKYMVTMKVVRRCMCVCACLCMCVHVCVRETDKQKGGEREIKSCSPHELTEGSELWKLR